LLEIGGKRLPFLRWSLLRMVAGANHLTTHWQVGDGREEALAAYVEERSRKGDLDDVINAIDDFCYHRSLMMNVGDEKGGILERAIRRAHPARLLELGTYCGYSALRTIRAMPQHARLWSIEFNPANADIARRIWDHAGVADQATLVVGTLGDQGQTIARLEAEHGFAPGTLDLVFIDHDKAAYLPDLERILDRGWLHPGSLVVADNVRFPGAPAYRRYMTRQQGKSWQTIEHRAHFEYQTLIEDLVLESEYLHD
jgi:catechol O-methyltransferase